MCRLRAEAMRVETYYHANLAELTVDKYPCYDTTMAEVKRKPIGLRWHKSKRDATLYLAGYLRFLACVRYWHGQELMEKAYRLVKDSTK